MTDSLLESPLMRAFEEEGAKCLNSERPKVNPKELTLNLEGTAQSSLVDIHGIRGGPPTLRDMDFELSHEQFDTSRFDNRINNIGESSGGNQPKKHVAIPPKELQRKKKSATKADRHDSLADFASEPVSSGSVYNGEEEHKILHYKIGKIQGKIRQMKLGALSPSHAHLQPPSDDEENAETAPEEHWAKPRVVNDRY